MPMDTHNAKRQKIDQKNDNIDANISMQHYQCVSNNYIDNYFSITTDNINDINTSLEPPPLTRQYAMNFPISML